MELDDIGWAHLRGGYRIPYDPRPALRALKQGKETAAAWNELWNELYHQGDVGEASYAAVPHLVRIYEATGVPDSNTYQMVAIIEQSRKAGQNPDLPANLRVSYEAAWCRLAELGLRELEAADDPTLISCIIAVLAMRKGQFALGCFAALFDENERKGILTGWV
jgi:hypothetical protein